MSAITKTTFGHTRDGREAFRFRLPGANGAYADVTNYGAIWLNANLPGRDGQPVAVCLSYDSLSGYESDGMFIGMTVGRYANRIGGAAFELNGKRYTLDKNDGENCLHGGGTPYGKRLWDYELLPDAVAFHLHSEDGDQGFPGNVDITVTYRFSADNALSIDYRAQSDQDTVVNLTNHAYLNLNGAASGADGALAQTLTVNGQHITEADGGCLPTGRLLPVSGTPFDFATPRAVGDRVDDGHPQLQAGMGYDANYCIDGNGLREAAVLTGLATGVQLRLSITNPGLQLYSGNHLQAPFARRGAVCLEPQHYPDAPNKAQFPSATVKVGEAYVQRTVYQFTKA